MMSPGNSDGQLSTAQTMRIAAWGFGFSIFCHVVAYVCCYSKIMTTRVCRCRNQQDDNNRSSSSSSSRNNQKWRCYVVWGSATLGFWTGLLKEALDGLPNADELWPWCGGRCHFSGHAVLDYYESCVAAMFLLMAISMIRNQLRKRRARLAPPPCDDTVAMSVDEEGDCSEDLDDLEDGVEGGVIDKSKMVAKDEKDETSKTSSSLARISSLGSLSRLTSSLTDTASDSDSSLRATKIATNEVVLIVDPTRSKGSAERDDFEAGGVPRTQQDVVDEEEASTQADDS